MVDAITNSTLGPLVDTGELDEALKVAARIADRLETREDVWNLVGVRAAQARILALRGQAAQVAGSLDWIESTSRGAGDAQLVVLGRGASALAHAATGQDDRAAALLMEIEAAPGAREILYYAILLPAMVRAALGIGDPELAQRLAAGVGSRYPYAEHALVAANAALAEARGDLQVASEAYSEAADRWERFGVVTEQAFALLGHGRCLLGLARPTEAAPVLHRAREIFERLGAAPALAETDGLLQQVTALSS
jgi:ATP/maltotriose-dependent transcriptional regulator MalT